MCVSVWAPIAIMPNMIRRWSFLQLQYTAGKSEVFCTRECGVAGGKSAWGQEIIDSVGKLGGDSNPSQSIKRLPMCRTISMHS